MGGLVAALCVLAIPIWILGIPGVNNAYATGWTIGLFALLLYPLAWSIVMIVWLALRKRKSGEGARSFDRSIGLASVAALGMAIFVLIFAFVWMSRA